VNQDHREREVDADATPVPPLFILTFLFSVATAVMWNGLGFVAKESYDFPEWLTFLLFVVNGCIYAVAAFGCGAVLRAVEDRLSPRGLLALVLVIQAVTAPLMGIANGPWAIWVVSIIFSICSAGLWSMVESYMSSGRHGRTMRTTIGWWNLCWMASNALGLAAMTIFMGSGNSRWSVAALGPVCLLGTLMVFWFPARPAAHVASAPTGVGHDRLRPMLRSSRVMLPMSYVLIGALGPIMPYRLDDLSVGLEWVTPLTAIWLVTRVGMVFLMSHAHFWHGRWGSLGAAGTLMGIGFGLISVGPGIASVLWGLALLGIGQGIVYYSAIYYVLVLGNADVDAAGSHEGLIGVGYAAGPAAGLVGLFVGPALGIDNAIGWVVLFLAAGCAWPAVSPWWRSRRSRTGARSHLQ